MERERRASHAILSSLATLSRDLIEGEVDNWAHDALTASRLPRIFHMHFRAKDTISGRPHHGTYVQKAAQEEQGVPFRR